MRLVAIALLALALMPAAAMASERSEARAYAAAMRPLIEATPAAMEQAETERQARAEQIVATCGDTLQAAMRSDLRAFEVQLTYLLYVLVPVMSAMAPLEQAADARLAAIETETRLLRRARAARLEGTTTIARFRDAFATFDFCAVMEAWRAARWKGSPLEDATARLDTGDEDDARRARRAARRIRRAARLLRRYGATRREALAFRQRAWGQAFAGEDAVTRFLESLAPAPRRSRG